MAKAPFRLIAIVYRPDLRVAPRKGVGHDPGFGGEGRFVFNLLDAAGKPIKETVIFEYSLPIFSELGTLTWAYRFHLMGSIPFGETFNNVLALITNGFAGPGADPRRTNGNALNQLRTNELALVHESGCASPAVPPALCPPASTTPKTWEMREFRINAAGKLAQHAMNMDPSRDFDTAPRSNVYGVLGTGTRSNELAKFMLDNAAAVAAGTHTIPKHMLANSTYIGSGAPQWGVAVKFAYTSPSGVRTEVPEAVRAGFALQTCGGCHRHEVSPVTGSAPTTTFLHIYSPESLDPAEANDQVAIGQNGSSSKAGLSDFVKKEVAVGGPRYNDLTSILANPFSVLPFKGKKVCAGDHES
jgi:hypothetical protein